MATDTAEPEVEQGQDEQATTVFDKLEREHYQEIRRLNNLLLIAKQRYLLAKHKASGDKKEYDLLVDELEQFIARGPDLQTQLAFDGDDGGDDLEPWQDAPLASALALPPSYLEKLSEQDVKTMGELEAFRESPGLLSVVGFGQAAVDKIEDQVIDWLTENRDKFGEPVEADGGDEDEIIETGSLDEL